MFSQPCLKRLGGTVRQQVYGAAPLQVHQNGGVVLPAPKREVIDSEYPHRKGGRGTGNAPPELAQQGIGTAEQQSQSLGHFGASLAAQTVDQKMQRPRKAQRLARIPIGNGRETLGEDAPRTGGVVAEELAHRELKLDRNALPGEVRKRSSIAAMHAMSTVAALRAGSRLGTGADAKDDQSVLGSNAVDGKGRRVRQKCWAGTWGGWAGAVHVPKSTRLPASFGWPLTRRHQQAGFTQSAGEPRKRIFLARITVVGASPLSINNRHHAAPRKCQGVAEA